MSSWGGMEEIRALLRLERGLCLLSTRYSLAWIRYFRLLQFHIIVLRGLSFHPLGVWRGDERGARGEGHSRAERSWLYEAQWLCASLTVAVDVPASRVWSHSYMYTCWEGEGEERTRERETGTQGGRARDWEDDRLAVQAASLLCLPFVQLP